MNTTDNIQEDPTSTIQEEGFINFDGEQDNGFDNNGILIQQASVPDASFPRLQYESSEASQRDYKHNHKNNISHHQLSLSRAEDNHENHANSNQQQQSRQYSFGIYNGLAETIQDDHYSKHNNNNNNLQQQQSQKLFSFDPVSEEQQNPSTPENNNQNKNRKTMISHNTCDEDVEQANNAVLDKQSPPSWISLAHLRNLTTTNKNTQQIFIDSQREQQQDSFMLQTFDDPDAEDEDRCSSQQRDSIMQVMPGNCGELQKTTLLSSQCQLSSQSINLEEPNYSNNQQEDHELIASSIPTEEQRYDEVMIDDRNLNLYENSERDGRSQSHHQKQQNSGHSHGNRGQKLRGVAGGARIFKKLQLQVDEQNGESHSSDSKDILVGAGNQASNNSSSAIEESKIVAMETLKGCRRQIDLEFENSSKNSDNDQLVAADLQNEPAEFINGKDESLNIIDKLLSERDSQFSNFNEKIDRLRNGHSTSSYKDYRRGILSDTIGYHSSSSKPKLHRVQEINWSKQRFVLSAKNQQQRRDNRPFLKTSLSKPKPSLRVIPSEPQHSSQMQETNTNSTQNTKSHKFISQEAMSSENRNQPAKQKYSFLASNTNQQIKLMFNKQGSQSKNSKFEQSKDVGNKLLLNQNVNFQQSYPQVVTERHQLNRVISVDSNNPAALPVRSTKQGSQLQVNNSSLIGIRSGANYMSRGAAQNQEQQSKISPTMQQSRMLQRRQHRSKSPGALSNVTDSNHLQKSFKILSLLDGSSSLNQALQMSNSGVQQYQPQIITTTNPANINDEMAAESTWRSNNINSNFMMKPDQPQPQQQRQSSVEQMQQQLVMTLDELEIGNQQQQMSDGNNQNQQQQRKDGGYSYSLDMKGRGHIMVENDAVATPINNDYSDHTSSIEPAASEQAKLLEELRNKWDITQQEHKRELKSLKTTFVSQQEELVEHFQGMIQRQEKETNNVIENLAARCQQLELMAAQRWQGNGESSTEQLQPQKGNKNIFGPTNESITDRSLPETHRERNSRFSRPVVPADSTNKKPNPPRALMMNNIRTNNFVQVVNDGAHLNNHIDDNQNWKLPPPKHQATLSSSIGLEPAHSLSNTQKSDIRQLALGGQTPFQGQGQAQQQSKIAAGVNPSENFTNLIHRRPQRQVRLFMSTSSPSLGDFTPDKRKPLAQPHYPVPSGAEFYPMSGGGPLLIDDQLAQTSIKKSRVRAQFGSFQQSQVDEEKEKPSYTQTERKAWKKEQQLRGPKLISSIEPLTSYSRQSVLEPMSNLQKQQRKQLVGNPSILMAALDASIPLRGQDGSTVQMQNFIQRETTIPMSPHSDSSNLLMQTQARQNGKNNSRQQTPQRQDSLEDCEVRDEDEEYSVFHPNSHNGMQNDQINRLTTDGLVSRGAILNSKQLMSPKVSQKLMFQHPIEASARSSANRRNSSGKIESKLVTNESIRPLPTSFALQNSKESNRSNFQPSIHSIYSLQRTTEDPVLPKTSLNLEDTLPKPEDDDYDNYHHLQDLIEISEATQVAFMRESQTDQTTLFIDEPSPLLSSARQNPQPQHQQLVPMIAQSTQNLGRRTYDPEQVTLDQENIISERSMAGAFQVPNYRNVTRNTLLIQPVQHRLGLQKKQVLNQQAK